MDVPGVVAEALEGETVRTRVGLDGAGVDALYVTDTRTVAYDDEGLLSDASVTEVPHDIERITVSEGRRKATVTLADGLGNDYSVVVPARQADEALAPLLAGVLATRGITDEGESVVGTYRFSELTLVVTSDRVIKHVGGAVWDEAEHEAIRYADVRDIATEEGSVSTQLVIETANRQERIKTPADSAREVHGTIENALLTYHGVDSYDRFREAVTAEEGEGTAAEGADTGFVESDLDPIGTAGPGEQPVGEASGDTDRVDTGVVEAGADADRRSDAAADTGGAEADAGGDDATTETGAGGFAGSEFESAAARQSPDPEAVEAELRALEEALARQAELIEQQRDAVAGIVDELNLD